MYDEIIKKILESVGNDPLSSEKIDAGNFHQIKKLNSNKKIAFVDGGNAEIMGSANFSLNIIRVGYLVYINSKKITFKKCTFFAFIRALDQNNKIYYKVSLYGTKNPNFLKNFSFLEDLSFSSFDKTLMLGINRAEISNIANAVRRFAELRTAKIISEQNVCEIIVLDGSLQTAITHEDKYMDELHESCTKNDVILTAISKTSSLFTDNGNLLSVVLDNLSRFPSWSYHTFDGVFFVKFHNKSKHIFRFEILNSQKSNAQETINTLSAHCVDPLFVGYPYGLVDADRIARVSNQEKESLKIMFLIKLKNKSIEKYLSSVNAHEILDRKNF